jgi:hypothetical protein
MMSEASLQAGDDPMKPEYRREVQRLMDIESIPISVIAREAGVSPDAIFEWLAGARKSRDFERRLADFIDNRERVWMIIRSPEGKDSRAQVAERFISNCGVLVDELVKSGQMARMDVRDHIFTCLHDLKRLIGVMAEHEEASAEQIAATMRKALAPGDRMVIARAGGNQS